ncbi:MAG: tyrosine-protein phosphatase [Firmicutes bacterium]|nr:tyrosine-protein phosphatase [Bacillota bacterium]
MFNKKSILIAAICLCLCAGLLAGCGGSPEETEEAAPAPALADGGLLHEHEPGGICIDISIDEFNALGFEFGDSVDIFFSNGYRMENIPYYNGYYTAAGEPLLVGYPGSEHIKAGINSGDDLWEAAGLQEGDTATVTLREKAGYLDVQNARDLHYEDDRGFYSSDEVFANFRPVRGGRLKENALYRSASPCDNTRNRALFADSLMAGSGVVYILDLADDDETIGRYFQEEGFVSPYFRSLYENGQVMPLALNMNYGSDAFKAKIVKGLTALAENEGPCLIHCTEGKDRTGFVCMLLEALAGAGYEEIVTDYMITYENYYGITKEGDGIRYGLIVEGLLDPMLRSIAGDGSGDLKTTDLAACARQYLIDIGMSEEEIGRLESRIMKGTGSES